MHASFSARRLGGRSKARLGAGAAPTGLVFNGSRHFVINSDPALFIFASEAGKITAWNQSTMPPTEAQTIATVHDAIFKGLAITGTRLYATDFHNNRVDVWNGQ